jgi:hypothetical protein
MTGRRQMLEKSLVRAEPYRAPGQVVHGHVAGMRIRIMMSPASTPCISPR